MRRYSWQDVSPARWMQFRIGINLGDVIDEENDIFGDGVSAAVHAAEVLKREPKFSVAVYLATQHYQREADRKRHEAGLLMAGLPV